MEFQDLFEELESKFAETPYRWGRDSNCALLQTINQEFFDLLAPIIGVDFVAGLAHEHGDWICFANSHIASISLKKVNDHELPLLRTQDLSLTGFIRTLDRPVRVTLRHANNFESAVNLLDADEQFLIAERDVLIPSSGVRQLRVLGSNKWQ